MARPRATARHPQAWSHLVEQLTTAQDVATFLGHLLDLQCKVVAGEYGAIWTREDDDQPKLACAWPEKIATLEPRDNPTLRMLDEAAAGGFTKRVSHVLQIDQSASAKAGTGAHVFVTVMRLHGEVEVVSTVVAHVSDSQVIQSTAAVRELAAGLYDGFEARRDAIQYQAIAQRVRQAMAILAVSQEGPGFDGSCLNLVNELAQQFNCTRVSLGWVRPPQVRLIEISDTENLKRHSEQVALTELAMGECLDQQQPIVFPLAEDAEPILQHAVVYAHRRLVAAQPSRYVLSIPLRDRDKWLGVLTLERSDKPFDAQGIAQMQLTADVLTPHLADRRHSDRYLPVHAWHTVRDAASYLVGPRHVAWKLVGLFVLAAVIYGGLGTWPYRVSSPFVIEAKHKRILSAPFEGAIESTGDWEGKFVHQGMVLAKLETDQLELKRKASIKDREAYNLQRRDAMRDVTTTADAGRFQKLIEQADARVALLEDRISRATLESPIDGQVLKGKWNDKIASIVGQGQPLFEIARIDQPGDLVAILHVSEEDIDHVTRAMGKRSDPNHSVLGEMATRSDPSRTFAIRVMRIVPLAEPVDGMNGFSTRCQIIDPEGLRPGMQGTAKLIIDRRKIAWILTHRIVDTLRLWLWY